MKKELFLMRQLSGFLGGRAAILAPSTVHPQIYSRSTALRFSQFSTMDVHHYNTPLSAPRPLLFSQSSILKTVHHQYKSPLDRRDGHPRRHYSPEKNGPNSEQDRPHHPLFNESKKGVYKSESDLTYQDTLRYLFSEKYIKIRAKFLEKFCYEGLVAEEIKTKDNTSEAATTYVKFGDQTVYLGLALLNFACEAKVLKNAQLDNSQSNHLIGKLLEKLSELETKGPNMLVKDGRGVYKGAKEGFFIRDCIDHGNAREGGYNIPSDVIDDNLKSDYMEDVTRKTGDAAPSQDQIAHVLVGLWAVDRIGKGAVNQTLREKAAAQAKRIIGFLKDHNFLIYFPAQTRRVLVPRGPDGVMMSSFFHKINEALKLLPSFWMEPIDLSRRADHLPLDPRLLIFRDFLAALSNWILREIPCVGKLKIEVQEIERLLRDVIHTPREADLEFVKTILNQIPEEPSLPDLEDPKEWLIRLACRELIKRTLPGQITKVREKFENAKSFEANLTLIAAAFDSQIRHEKFSKDALQYCNNNVWAVLLKTLFEEKDLSKEAQEKVDALLEECPEEGPNELSSSQNWWKSNRWICSKDLLKESYQRGDRWYNGLDYLNLEAMTVLWNPLYWNQEPRSFIQVTAEGDQEGWFLDFMNESDRSEVGNTKLSTNLVLVKQESKGSQWKITQEGDYVTLQATAGRFKGWFLDFHTEGTVEQEDGVKIWRNLVLTQQKTRGAQWQIIPRGEYFTLQCVEGPSNEEKWFLDISKKEAAGREGERPERARANLILACKEGRGTQWKISNWTPFESPQNHRKATRLSP